MTTTQHLLPIGMDRDDGSGPPEGSARATLGGISRPTLYGLVNSGELVHVKIGRRGFITAASLDAYIERLTDAAQKANGAPRVRAKTRQRITARRDPTGNRAAANVDREARKAGAA